MARVRISAPRRGQPPSDQREGASLSVVIPPGQVSGARRELASRSEGGR